MATPVMSTDDTAYQQAPGGYPNDKGFGGPHAQGAYPPQGYPNAQGAYPAQSYPPNTYQGQGVPVGPDEYVDRNGQIQKRRKRGACLAACLACCWCITWPCHAICCCGL